MKTYVTYGFGSALAGALLALALYFGGFQTVEKFELGQRIQMIVGLIIGIVFIVLGTRARRAEVPLTEPFGYGQALGAGLMTALFSCLFGAIFTFIYVQFINPGAMDIALQVQTAKWEQAGMNADQIAGAESFMRKLSIPWVQSLFAFVGGMFFSLLIALVTSIFLRRKVVAEPPPIAA